MNKRIGITVGKFMPMHVGHEAMIEFAANQLDKLIVVVSSTRKEDHSSKMTLEKRFAIINHKYKHNPHIKVVQIRDEYGPARSYDKEGTAIDEDFWDYWTNTFADVGGDGITHFVSSDRYGKEAAGRMGISWMAFDPDRELFDISATKIRATPQRYWSMIVPEFRSCYSMAVTVIGPESSGKSTLVKDLAQAWGTLAVPEYGRIMTEMVGDRKWTADDFRNIVIGHYNMVNIAHMKTPNGLVFIDTETYTTNLFAEIYLDEAELKDYTLGSFALNPGHLLVLLEPNLPWVDDGSRILSSQKDRERFYQQLYNRYKILDDNLLVIKETDRRRRVDLISDYITKNSRFRHLVGEDFINKSADFSLTNHSEVATVS